MGFLSFIPFLGGVGDEENLGRLPSGTFTMDPSGGIVSSTLPQSFPQARIKEIGRCVMHTFANAKKARIPLTEIHVHYSTLKITAREMRGSAVVFVTPQTLEESSY
ncbi:MAG: hypothetical protein JNN07_21005 [Verrucomicrobiales bacterium]|jgi:hypothetical protein|nr:hypothetical protein [Verrucomicrobiales bacterium]